VRICTISADYECVIDLLISTLFHEIRLIEESRVSGSERRKKILQLNLNEKKRSTAAARLEG
jgi:hypothetical protein